jgi:hypothetical protein
MIVDLPEPDGAEKIISFPITLSKNTKSETRRNLLMSDFLFFRPSAC